MQGSLLPFIHDASRHIERTLAVDTPDLARVRLVAGRDLAALAVAPNPPPPSAARVAAELLYLAERLEIESGESPHEELPADAPAGAADDDVRALSALSHHLTQNDVTRALSHLKRIAAERGVDLVQALALAMKCERVRRVMREATLLVAA